ncbi:MAG TPA: CcmD family protein [Bacteroidota bacterium]|nr:CcmD family protein [Bacteroidota bacterium]
MYDFLTENALYIVLLIVLICWIGIFSYLIRLDRRLSKIEQSLKR